MTKIDWEPILIQAVDILYERDSALFDRDVHEVAISHRLAIYLEQILREKKLLGDCSVDLEYNRNLSDPKHLSQNRKKTNPMSERPDILVHERGNHKKNLLIVEIKTKGSPRNDSDDEKLKGATSPHREYKYGCGLFLSLNTEFVSYSWYSKGEQRKTVLVVSSDEYDNDD